MGNLTAAPSTGKNRTRGYDEWSPISEKYYQIIHANAVPSAATPGAVGRPACRRSPPRGARGRVGGRERYSRWPDDGARAWAGKSFSEIKGTLSWRDNAALR